MQSELDVTLVEGEQRLAANSLALGTAFVPLRMQGHLRKQPLNRRGRRWNRQDGTCHRCQNRELLQRIMLKLNQNSELELERSHFTYGIMRLPKLGCRNRDRTLYEGTILFQLRRQFIRPGRRTTGLGRRCAQVEAEKRRCADRSDFLDYFDIAAIPVDDHFSLNEISHFSF